MTHSSFDSCISLSGTDVSSFDSCISLSGTDAKRLVGDADAQLQSALYAIYAAQELLSQLVDHHRDDDFNNQWSESAILLDRVEALLDDVHERCVYQQPPRWRLGEGGLPTGPRDPFGGLA